MNASRTRIDGVCHFFRPHPRHACRLHDKQTLRLTHELRSRRVFGDQSAPILLEPTNPLSACLLKSLLFFELLWLYPRPYSVKGGVIQERYNYIPTFLPQLTRNTRTCGIQLIAEPRTCGIPFVGKVHFFALIRIPKAVYYQSISIQLLKKKVLVLDCSGNVHIFSFLADKLLGRRPGPPVL